MLKPSEKQRILFPSKGTSRGWWKIVDADDFGAEIWPKSGGPADRDSFFPVSNLAKMAERWVESSVVANVDDFFFFV